jgi:hypothetical protein
MVGSDGEESFGSDEPTDVDIRRAQRAVAIHVPERWPNGVYCRSCRTDFPCRLNRWGLRVLRTAGRQLADVLDLLHQAEAGRLP